jgi:hypothetical protein
LESDDDNSAEDNAGFGGRDTGHQEPKGKSGSRLKAVGSDDWEEF